MQKLFSKSALFSLSLLFAACGDVNLGAEKTDGGDGAAGTPGGGGILGTGGTTVGSGGLLGSGGQTVGSGGMVGTGGTAVGPGTGGIFGTGGKGSGGVVGTGGTCSNKCANDASGSDSQDSSAAKSCTYNGRIYPDSTSWFEPGGCENECTCQNGYAGCSLLPCDPGTDAGPPSYSCTYNGKSYSYGDTFPSTDGCNICECGFYWYRDNPPGAIFVSCTSRDCSTPRPDAGSSDGGVDACAYNGQTYPADTYFPSADGCDECHCRTDGQITCTFQHIGCRSDAGVADTATQAADATADSTVAPGCDVAAAQAEMTARGLVLAGAPETMNETLPSPISGPNWGLKSTACEDGGYDISSLAGETICLVKQPIAPACENAPYLAWTVMSGGTVKCVYRNNDSTPGIFAVDAGYTCP